MSSEESAAGRRPYRKTRRAAAERETRRRITEAAVELHQALGPARTTVKAIAERAGVERATVYRHFPDEEALFSACTAHYYARHPMPDPGRWRAIAPPVTRPSTALTELYAWYGETEQMLAAGIRDLDYVPAGAAEAFLGYFADVRSALMAGRPERGRARARVAAAIGHAIAFSTWRSLVREQGLADEEAVALMAALIEAAPRRRHETTA